MFHISQIKIDEIIWTPRLCKDSSIPSDKFFEPPIPRICISPTMAQCLLAMGMYIETPEKWNKLYVYRPHNYKRILAHSVHDAHLTDEHWIIHKTQMDYSGFIWARAKQIIQFRFYEIGHLMNRLDFEVRF